VYPLIAALIEKIDGGRQSEGLSLRTKGGCTSGKIMERKRSMTTPSILLLSIALYVGSYTMGISPYLVCGMFMGGWLIMNFMQNKHFGR
jgi:hypothetical protein